MVRKHLFKFKIAALIIVLALYIVFLRDKSFREAFNLLKTLSPYYIFLTLSLSVLIQYFKALSYNVLLISAGLPINKNMVVKLYFATQAVTFLPGGEMARVFLTKVESKGSIDKAASVVVAHGFIETMSALVIVLVGALFFPIFRLPALISLLILGLVLITLMSSRIWGKFIKLILLIKYLQKYKTILLQIQKHIRSHIFEPDTIKVNRRFFGIITYAFISQFVGGLFVYIINLAFGLNLNFLTATLSFSLSILIQNVISIVPGGVGFTEGGLIGLLVSFGNSIEKSLALTLTYRITGLLFNIFTGLVFSFLYFRRYMKSFFNK